MLEKSTTQRCPARWTRSEQCKGDGFLVEGELLHMHMHNLTGAPPKSKDNLPARFIAIQMSVTRVTKRKWSPEGQEIEPDEAVTRTELKGYLTKVRTTSQPATTAADKASIEKVLTEAAGRCVPGSFVVQKSQTHPAVSGVFEFWLDAAEYVAGDFAKGRHYRLKTVGDTPIVEGVTRTDDGSEKEVLRHYAGGDEIGSSWSTQLSKMGKKSDPEASEGPQIERDDSEWD